MPFTVLDPSLAQIAPATNAGLPTTNGMPFADFKDGIIEDMQGRGDISSRIGTWVNRAYKNLAAMLDINEMWASVSIPLVANQPFYLVPDTLAWVKWFGISDSIDYRDGGREFEMIDLQTYRTLPESSSFATTLLLPYKYFRFARMLVTWPTPSTALTTAMDFRVRPLDLVNDSDCPMLPPEFHPVIYEWATAIAQRKTGNRAEGDRTYNDGLSILRPLLNSDASEKDAMHMSMQPVRRRSQLYRGAL